MNICPSGKNLKKPNFLVKKHFIVNLTCQGRDSKMQEMKISDFPIYSFTNDLLP